jgi:predicted nucleotidyltransferase
MKTLGNIKTLLKKHKAQLCAKYPIVSLAVFGSYSRNEQTNTSDVDILVDFSAPIGIKFIDLADDLEQILGKNVDLVSKKGIKEPYFNAIKSDLLYV